MPISPYNSSTFPLRIETFKQPATRKLSCPSALSPFLKTTRNLSPTSPSSSFSFLNLKSMFIMAMALIIVMNGAVLILLMSKSSFQSPTSCATDAADDSTKASLPSAIIAQQESEKTLNARHSKSSSAKTIKQDLATTSSDASRGISSSSFDDSRPQLTPIMVLNEEFYPITVATTMKDGSCKLLHSAMRQGIHMNIIGYGIKDFKLQQKIGIIMNQISKIKNPNALLLFVDAYDVLFFQNAETIVAKYLKLFEKKQLLPSMPENDPHSESTTKEQRVSEKETSTATTATATTPTTATASSSNSNEPTTPSVIAYCAEKNCHPYGLIQSAKERWGEAFCDRFPRAPNGYRFLNSGAFMGRQKDVIALFNRMIHLDDDVKHDLYGDQGMTSYVWLTTEELHDSIKLDYWGELFFSLLDARMSNLALERQPPKDAAIAKTSNSGIWFRNAEHKNYPSIVHGNGWGKHILKNLNSRIAWRVADLNKEKAINYCYVNGEKKKFTDLCNFS
ncbi:hypothetical protein C9374_013565 [Naegleria lovaniensis]|uniref:PLOD1-3-like GT domain-containing protein n=1 Tax=Naegleria lovaniensis TaxID=51637 RepID=A0AA88KVS7_NAELO|nr:uncharacterized protein C9374_013565 [Naegleria lovaniensis]KAG2392080.1 hypothetical protein C9374_013565 [Naegleria lovaniensis]